MAKSKKYNKKGLFFLEFGLEFGLQSILPNTYSLELA